MEFSTGFCKQTCAADRIVGFRMENDVVRAYQLHAICYLQKPGSAEEFTGMMKLLFDFWHMCEIPKLTSSECAEANPSDKK